MKLLHVDSSILGAHSISRQLSAEIVANLRLADLERQCTIFGVPSHLKAWIDRLLEFG
jgi:FMN-dependent NADH-azoreductase